VIVPAGGRSQRAIGPLEHHTAAPHDPTDAKGGSRAAGARPSAKQRVVLPTVQGELERVGGKLGCQGRKLGPQACAQRRGFQDQANAAGLRKMQGVVRKTVGDVAAGSSAPQKPDRALDLIVLRPSTSHLGFS
jgi:hypothetical protein